MKFEVYKRSIGGTLSEVKSQILSRLWGEGDGLPRGWVTSSELLALTGQKYFDRRVRELRDESGCDIETGTYNGSHAYRLVSTTIEGGNQRHYLTSSQKQVLFTAAHNSCAVCGQQFPAGVRGLQADHKIPLIRGGAHGIANWQALCVECNVGKRSACAGCSIDCRTCVWAFPEHVGLRLVLPLKPEILEQLKKLAAADGVLVSEFVADVLTEELNRRR